MNPQMRMDVLLKGLQDIVQEELTEEIFLGLQRASKEELIDLRATLGTILHL